MATVNHTFTSAIADDPTAAAAGEVLPSHWNAGHTLTGVTASTDALLVAAVDAAASVIAAADYTCDGTADEVQINAALATGRNVVLSTGTFTCANTVTGFVDGQQLVGGGRDTLVRITGAVAGLHVINAVGTSEGSPLVGVVIANLRVQGYGDDAGVTSTSHGLRFKFVTRGRIANIWAHDVTFSAVILHDSFYCTVEDITVERGVLGTNGGWYGLTIDNQVATVQSTGHVISNVVANVIEHGLTFQTADDAVATGIVVINSRADYAINLTACKRVIIDGWVIIGGHGGVYMETACDRIKIANGMLQAAGTAHALNGIFVSASTNVDLLNIDVDLTGQTSGNGIRIDPTSHNASIVNCTARNTFSRGIYVENGANYALVAGCYSIDSAGPGFQIGTGTKARVFGNYAYSNTGDGFQLACTRSQIFGNVSDTNGGAGFFAQFFDDCVLSGNIAHGNTGYGIDHGSAASNSERNMVTGNQLSGNTAGAYRASTSSGANVNIVRDNVGYVTEASGTGTIASGATSVSITHGLGFTPTAANIAITPTNSPTNDPGTYYADTFGATTFTVRVRADPGASTATFAWLARA